MTGFKIGAGVVIAAIGAAGLVVVPPRPPAPTHKGDLSIEARIARETAAGAGGIQPFQSSGRAGHAEGQARLLEPPAPRRRSDQDGEGNAAAASRAGSAGRAAITAGPDVDRLPVRSWHWLVSRSIGTTPAAATSAAARRPQGRARPRLALVSR